MNDKRADRALAALQGLAIGDAMGMPTQSMPRAWIARHYGLVHGFHASGDEQPIAPNMAAGTITDDTEQVLLLARLLIAGGGTIDQRGYADALIEWERDMRARGSRDLLGPSTARAIELIQSGVDPALTGRTGTTNGAAMRVTPIGIAFPSDDLDRFVDAVEASALISHNTSLGISSAAAVAAAVSAGIAGADFDQAMARAVEAARIGARRGAWIAGGSIAERIVHACALVANREGEDLIGIATDVIGTSVASQESVPVAFALAWRFQDRPELALSHAVSVGGDTDTIGAIAGAILGATARSAPWPQASIDLIERINGIALRPVATDLLALRAMHEGGR